MKKRLTRAVFLLLAAAFVLAAYFVGGSLLFAGDDYSRNGINRGKQHFAASPQGQDYSYTIKSINTTVTVNEDSTVDFVEEITVDFYSPHLGIYRDLPTNSGERYENIEIIKSEWYSVSHIDGFLRISLGLPDGAGRVTGVHSYKIGYTLIMPPRAESGDLYLNLIGFGFDTDIETANITMYVPTYMENMSFYTGYGSSSASDKVEVSDITRDEASGKYKYTFAVGGLDAFSGVTLRAEIAAGVVKDYSDPFPVAETLVFLAMVLIAAFLFIRASGGQLVTPITNYYPPIGDDGQKMTPADVGLYIDGTLSAKDITSMIFYWASKGLVAIDDVQSDNPLLIKKREVSVSQAGGEQYLKLFDRIFSGGDEVRVDELQYKLTAPFSSITAKSRKKALAFYDKKTAVLSGVLAVLAILSAVAVAVIHEYITIKAYDIAPGYALFAIVMLAGYFALTALWKYKYKLRYYKFLAVLAFAALVVVGTLAALLPLGIMPDVITLAQALLLGAGASALVGAAAFCHRRTPAYIKILGEIVGFKNFLEVAEKDRLEMLLEENPQYYYDILPYAHVLDVSDKWEEKFKDIAVQPPQYITGGGISAFDIYLSVRLINSLDRGMRTAMSQKPSSSSRSGFGGFGGFGGGHGGGFGGGGFGGGGGGAR